MEKWRARSLLIKMTLVSRGFLQSDSPGEAWGAVGTKRKLVVEFNQSNDFLKQNSNMKQGQGMM